MIGLTLGRGVGMAVGCLIVGYAAYSLIAGTPDSPPALKSLDPGTIEVVEATYGLNCRPKFSVEEGNATSDVRETCNTLVSCHYAVDVRRLGDPADGCGKDFLAKWRCYRDPREFSVLLPAEANSQVAALSCEQGR